MNTSIADPNARGSRWDGLSDKLIASFYPVQKSQDGTTWDRIPDSRIVKAPLTEASMDVTLNWQSPFENSGPESKAPALLAMLQSGALQPVVDAVMGGKKDGATDANLATQKSNEFLKQFEGRTGITKLNSTQVFTGMPPVKMQVTALFRAWSDTHTEVMVPSSRLMRWALPDELSTDGSILARAAQSAKGEMSYLDALLPSKTPTIIAMQYKLRTYAPLVIESISHSMSGPTDKNGRYTELQVNMTLCTLTAIDQGDWSSYVPGQNRNTP